LVIVLSVIFRNTALLVFSLYIYCLPTLNPTPIHNTYLSYIVLISFSLLMFISYLYDRRRDRAIYNS
jgi:divalent metal cation (Fe/Co/Zn/Cd) transporter